MEYTWTADLMRCLEAMTTCKPRGLLRQTSALGLVRIVFYLLVIFLPLDCDARPSSQHIKHKRLKTSRTNAIEQEMLAKLGFTHRPDVRKFNNSVEEKRQMLRLYRKSLQETQGEQHVLFSEEEFFAKKFYSFKESDLSAMGSVWENDEDKLHVHLPVSIPEPEDANMETRIHSANLKLYKTRVWPEHLYRAEDWSIVGSAVRINVYQLLEPARTKGGTLKRLLDSQMVSLEDIGWEQFDIKQAVQDWVDDSKTNFGLELSCDTHRIGDMVQFARVDSSNSNSNVDDFTDELAPNTNILAQQREIIRRQKRAAHLEPYDCLKADEESRCCRYPLYISFRELGWDWIEEPEGFRAYYCDGSCPRDFRRAHSFTGLKSLLRLLNPDAAPAPCCTATELSPLTVLHRNEQGQHVVTHFTDMIVDNCGCA